jgi:hypothetical protein
MNGPVAMPVEAKDLLIKPVPERYGTFISPGII